MPHSRSKEPVDGPLSPWGKCDAQIAPKLGYEPGKDFVPVALVYKFGYVMVGRKDLPQANQQDIVAAA